MDYRSPLGRMRNLHIMMRDPKKKQNTKDHPVNKERKWKTTAGEIASGQVR
jgi:hypothetical protein